MTFRLPHGRVNVLKSGWYDNIFVHYRNGDDSLTEEV